VKPSGPDDRRALGGVAAQGITDHFGPRVKALALDLYTAAGMSEPAILTLLGAAWLVADLTSLHVEAAAIDEAGLASGCRWDVLR
jgi:hypothetical protein